MWPSRDFGELVCMVSSRLKETDATSPRTPLSAAQMHLKAGLDDGGLQVELRCERSTDYDLSRKHHDLSTIFYGESINLQVILRRDPGLFPDLSTQLLPVLESVTTAEVSSLSYAKLGASMMKIKSMESLAGSMSHLVSPQASMDNLTVSRSTSVLFEDDSTLVFNVPLVIPDLLEDEEDNIGGYSASKRIKISVSLFEKLVQLTDMSTLLEKTKAFGNYQLKSLIESSIESDEVSMKQICTLHKSLELVNPLEASLSLISLAPGNILLSTQISPTLHFEHSLTVESFELSASCHHGSQLLGKYLALSLYPGADINFPFKLQASEVFSFCHSLQIFDMDKIRSLGGLSVQAGLTGTYEDMPLRIELELPLDINQIAPPVDEDAEFSVTFNQPPEDIHVNVPFIVELTVRNNCNRQREISVAFPITDNPAVICLEPELNVGIMPSGSVHSLFPKFMALRPGHQQIECIQFIDRVDGTARQPSQRFNIYLSDNAVER